MVDLANSSRPIDIITIIEELRRHGELDRVGGEAYISDLISGLPDRPLADISHYVREVQEAAVRRLAVKLLDQAHRLADDLRVPTTALARIVEDLHELASGGEPLPPRFSEEALALRFSQVYAIDWRYVSRWGRWMHWDGMRWIEDDTLRVLDLMRGVCRGASAECSNREKSAAARLASKATSAAIEALARADRRHAATIKQWDNDPWLLNTPAGTLDLRIGQIREHRREDYITKMTIAGPGGDCPLWLAFIDRVTGGDLALQSFLQRMVGYLLTGSTREHALFFLYGTGANGKSVFLSTISELLGDYARTAPVSTFIATRTDQHPTDLAGLRGARLVTVIETEDGAQWAESKVKAVTGGDKIAARFMRGDFFEFTPEFKLVIAGNHKPGLRSVDEAMRRRLHLVPFTVTIPENERDPLLSEKLRVELPGILRWVIQGCITWQMEGLNPPAVVREATRDYLSAEDSIGRWIEERCTTSTDLWTPSARLFADFKEWCQRTGEHEGSQKRFTQQLEAHGFKRARTSSAKGFEGIALRSNGVPDVPTSTILHVSHSTAPPSHTEESGTSGIAPSTTNCESTAAVRNGISVQRNGQGTDLNEYQQRPRVREFPA
jgi:putative DNA primase/helicase